LNRYTQSDKIKQGSYPAIVSILCVAVSHGRVKCCYSLILLLKLNILDESYAAHIKEDAHQHELNDAPGAQHGAAQ